MEPMWLGQLGTGTPFVIGWLICCWVMGVVGLLDERKKEQN